MENIIIIPPGYRFYPTEEELIKFYLHNKLEGEREDMNRVIPILNIYDFHPSQLPQNSGEVSVTEREQWFFFVPRQESEARGGRPKRLTNTGYWKATGSPNHVYSSDNRIIGLKRTMVFYDGRAPNGTKTDWKMNEYKAIKYNGASSSNKAAAAAAPMLREEFSLCRVYKKSKCLRAFDRRPPPRSRERRGEEEHNKKGESSQTAIISSPESSLSSGEHGQMEPFLDWEEVDRFLGSEP